MRLLTWNIMHGGGPGRLCEIGLVLLEFAPDVIALNEFRARRGGSLLGVLADHGWRHQALSEAGPGENGVVIASRLPIESIDRHDRLGPGLRRRLVSARLVGGLTVTAAHVPDARRHDQRAMVGKTTVWHELIATARALSGSAHVILGDLNTGRHRLDEPGATFSCTALLGTLASLGYADAWRLVHGPRREGSWRGPGGGDYRLDHALVSACLAGGVAGAEYDRSALENRLSDHAPLVVELVWGVSGPCFSGESGVETQKTPEK